MHRYRRFAALFAALAALVVVSACTSGSGSSSATAPASTTGGPATASGPVIPPLTFTGGKPHPVDCWYTAHVAGGKAILSNGGKYTCHAVSS